MIRANDRGLATPPPVVEDDTAARPRILSIRNILIIVGVIAWLAVVFLFIIPQFTRQPAPPAAAEKPVAAAAQSAASSAAKPKPAEGAVPAGAGPKAVPSPQLPITGRVFNLSGTSGYKYVKMSVIAQFADEEGKFGKAKGEGLKKLQEEFVGEHAGALAAFNDVMTSVVSSKTAAELATPQGKETLRQELTSRFNQALGGSKEHVAYITFTDFVMQ